MNSQRTMIDTDTGYKKQFLADYFLMALINILLILSSVQARKGYSRLNLRSEILNLETRYNELT